MIIRGDETFTARAEWEAVFHSAMERSAIGMCLVAPDGTFLSVNPALCEMLGRDADDLVECSWEELTHPDDFMSDRTFAAEIAEGRRDHYRMLKRYLRPDGAVVWGDLSVGVVRGDDRSVRFFVSQIVDVTELVQARQAILESERHYRLLAEHAADAVLSLDPSGIITWTSPSTTAVFGWPAEDLVGRPLDAFIYSQDLRHVDEAREALRAGRTAIGAARARRPDGSHAWVSARAYSIDLDGGERGGSVVALRDVSEFVAVYREREELHARYRLLAEITTDVVAEIDEVGAIRWVSPSVESMTGWQPQQLVGTPALELFCAADLSLATAQQAELLQGTPVPSIELRVRRADGDTRWMSLHGEPLHDKSGAVVGAVIGMRGCEAEVVGRRALQTQSAGHSILARAESEQELLADMCQAAVDEAGYVFAWFGRRMRDERQSVEVVATSRQFADYLDHVRPTWGDETLGRGTMGRALRGATTSINQDFMRDGHHSEWLAFALQRGFRSSISVPVFVHGRLDGVFTVYAPERDAFDDHAVDVLEDLGRQLGFGIAKLRDAQTLVGTLRRSRLLSSAIEQADEAIVITDPDAAIIYANPAAERSSGFSLDEMVGHNPRIFQSGMHAPEHYQGMWSTLVGGEAWRGVLVNRRRNGDTYEELATIAPVYDTDRSLVAYVAVKRDVTRERDLEAGLSQVRSDHQALVDVMAGVHRGVTLEETAHAFCAAACRLDDVDGALVLLLRPENNLRVIANTGPTATQFSPGSVLPVNNEIQLQTQIERGIPWHVDFCNPQDHRTSATGARFRAAGVTSSALVAIHWDDEVTGAVAILSTAPDGSARLRARDTVIAEIGAFAASLFGNQLASRRDREAGYARIRACIDEDRFHPVYQPVVDLARLEVCGYEALTRFDDGGDPESTFALAHAVGLGPELETAAVRRALAEAPALPVGAWVSVNLSPTAILDGRAAQFLGTPERQVVVEITERTAIQDYPQIRHALDAVPGLWISIDDAGAGFASLRHILELRPRIVKMDVALVRNIDTDPARQGLAAGLAHFAAQIGAQLVAEGVETSAEAAMLQRLGVLHGQGFLYGRPSAIA